jgi:GntR family transcriptional regulator
MIDRRKHIPLYIQLKNEILEKIRDGVWEIDSQLPTEKEFMEKYELGRATVREAISRLVTEGYVYKKHGVGTFVARKMPSLGFEPLISLTSSLKARGINPRNSIEVEKLIVPDKKLKKKLKNIKSNEYFYLRRLRYAEEKPLAVEESYFSEEYKNFKGKFDLTGSLAKILLEEMKITIDKVEQIIVPRMATKKEQEDLFIDDNTLVLDLERWIYINNIEEPFYYVKFIIPGNIYSF